MAAPSPSETAAARLNVVVITVDQERRWADLPEGFPFAAALPNRARLARDSTSFTQMTCASNPCTPSRATLYTGQHFQRTGCFENFRDLPEGVPTIGSLLRKEGYYTAYKGKWHLTVGLTDPAELDGVRTTLERLGSKLPPPEAKGGDLSVGLEPHGFSDWNEHGDKWGNAHEGWTEDPSVARDAAAWLRTRGAALHRAGRPFLLAANFVNPHDIMFFEASAKQSLSRSKMGPFGTQSLRRPPTDALYEKRWGLGVPASLHAHEKDAVAADPARALPAAHALYRRFSDMAFGKVTSDAEYAVAVDYYLNCMADVDRHIGAVLDAVDDAGLAGSTAVVFTSDHGELLGAHGLRQKGSPLYKENIGVPFLVRRPGAAGGRSCGRVCSLVDAAPTVLSLALGPAAAAAASAAARLPGRDLSALVADPAAPGPRDAEGALFQFGMARVTGRDAPGLRPFVQAVVTERRVFGRFFANRDTRPATLAQLLARCDLVLYDRAADPGELRNLAATPALAARHADEIVRLNAALNGLLDREAPHHAGATLPWQVGDPPSRL